MTPRAPRLIRRPKRGALKGPTETPLVPVRGIAPRAYGTEWVIGYDGPVAVGLDLADVPEDLLTAMHAAFLEAMHAAAALQEEAVL